MLQVSDANDKEDNSTMVPQTVLVMHLCITHATYVRRMLTESCPLERFMDSCPLERSWNEMKNRTIAAKLHATDPTKLTAAEVAQIEAALPPAPIKSNPVDEVCMY